jgi:hypothetical protein
MTWTSAKDDIVKTAVDTFGISMVFKPAIGGIYPIKGIFDRAWIEMKMGSSIGISGFYPYVDVRLADLPARPTSGDKVTIELVDYRIVDCRDDGGGGARLVLQK